MLDLKDPMTEHIFKASGLIDGVKSAGFMMSVSTSASRQESLARCLPRFDEIRTLNRKHFGDSSFISSAIDEFEAGIRELAALGDGKITEDHLDGEGNCAVCGSPITRFNPWPDHKDHQLPWIVYCDACTKRFTPAWLKLCSFEGFGTDWI